MNIKICKTPLIAGARVCGKVIGPALLALAATATVELTPIRVRAEDLSAHSVHVSLAKLNLNSVEGARKAYSRITAAAYDVCGESTMDFEVMFRGPGECVQGAVARAVLDVQSVELSKLYIKRNGIKLAALHGVTSPIVTAENKK
jgi:UrcA family protein